MFRKSSELSFEERRNRALYRFLSEDLKRFLIEYALVESLDNFNKAKVDYPFVEKRELKPRAKVSESESQYTNSFILIMTEAAISAELKKYIRFFDDNKVTKDNLAELKLVGLHFADRFRKQQKYFETSKFYTFLKSLLKVDYALLVQRDQSLKTKNKYMLSHYHVRIDYLLDTAAELLGRELRYISKDIYEKGENFAHLMVEKLFEYYSFHHSASGRRTAALLAAQLLKDEEYLSMICVSSSESRTLTIISGLTIDKYLLLKLDNKAIRAIETHPNGHPAFRRHYLVRSTRDYGISVFKVVYKHNEHSMVPIDGKMRELKGDLNWLRIDEQFIIPKYNATYHRPIRYQIIYDQVDPLYR
ncbi:MAG: hypothetical protein ACN4E2_03180 [Nitrospinota bacterium]